MQSAPRCTDETNFLYLFWSLRWRWLHIWHVIFFHLGWLQDKTHWVAAMCLAWPNDVLNRRHGNYLLQHKGLRCLHPDCRYVNMSRKGWRHPVMFQIVTPRCQKESWSLLQHCPRIVMQRLISIRLGVIGLSWIYMTKKVTGSVAEIRNGPFWLFAS